jgi:hypothetical protein
VTDPVHLDLDALADLLAGEGADTHVEHVAACAGCAGRLDELAAAEVEVAAVLAALPVPAPPPGLADRLTAALAAEAPLTPVEPAFGPTAEADAPSRPGPTTVTPFPTARTRPRPRRRSRRPAAAAAADRVAAGTLAGAALRSGGRSSSDDAASSAAGGSGADPAADPMAGLAVSETGTDYAADGRLAGALPALLSGGGGPAEAAAAVPAPPDAVAPGDALDSGDTAASAPTRESARASGEGLERLRDPAALASCLQALLPPEDDALRPLALDYAAYGGQPALVVVLPATDTPDKVDVFVVGAGCAVGNDSTLFFTRLDRP